MISHLVISSQFMSWCVYVWKRNNPDGADTVMYVGSSSNGIRRFAGHHAMPTDYTDDDYVEVFPCGNKMTMINLERKLIISLKPRLNKTMPQVAIMPPLSSYTKKKAVVNR